MSENNRDLPRHVGLVLDGNRRWAKQQNIPTLEGHRQGAEVFKQIALDAFDRGIEFLSAFVFSTENWSRTEEEVGYLMKLVLKATEKYLDEFDRANVKIMILGRREGIKKDVLAAIERTETKTSNNTGATLALCFNYGGQEELVDAYKRMLDDGIKRDQISADLIGRYLYSPEVPELDLLIRTSGEQRTSGFMLYRAAYSEIYFSEKYWPDFKTSDLDEILDWYKSRERRFGS